MNRYVINPLASQDLNQIADYFAENNVEAGEQFFQEFKRKCEQLINFTNSGKSYKNIFPTLRERNRSYLNLEGVNFMLVKGIKKGKTIS